MSRQATLAGTGSEMWLSRWRRLMALATRAMVERARQTINSVAHSTSAESPAPIFMTVADWRCAWSMLLWRARMSIASSASILRSAAMLAKMALLLFSGSLAAIVAVLGWVYVAVAVTIYGAEMAALLNGSRPVEPKKVAARR